MKRPLALVPFALIALAASPAAAAPSAPPGPGAASEGAGQRDQGVVVGVNFTTSFAAFTLGNNILSLGQLQGGVFGGYKLGRFMFGLGFSVQSLAAGQATTVNATTTETAQSNTGILILPGLRVAIVRSSDQRVELFGQFDMGYGHTFTWQKPEPMGMQPSRSNDRLFFDIGPGVRYWIHPQFALSAMAGVGVNFNWDGVTQTVGQFTQTTRNFASTTTLLGGLELLGVF